MRLHVCAVGRLRAGPELELIKDYLTRFDRAGRPLSLGPCTMQEIDERKNTTMQAQGEALARACPQGAVRVVLDERGQVISSRAFAQMLAARRDAGASDLAFLIGGADGLAPELREGADQVLSFGAMVWPHMLARVMLAEQIYRAATILAGAPYHRD